MSFIRKRRACLQREEPFPSSVRLCLSFLLLIVTVTVTRSFSQTAEQFTFSSLGKQIPDGAATGVNDIRTVSSSIASLSSIRVRLHIIGEFNGDIYGYLRHIAAGSTNFCVLLNRTGR